jgi:glycosyltransferase involved in cell wall biosynthesis
MPSPPLVSVVVIFLNEERFLEEAIASVLAQTYDHWELLLVDDGSTDASTGLAQGYAARYPGRIRYLEHEGHQNRGASAARNLGVRHARGSLIAFLDADDVWEPNKLAEQVAIMNAHSEAGMVCGTSLYWRSWTGQPGDDDVAVPVGAPADTLVRPPGLALGLYPLGKGAAPCPSGLMTRREVIEQVGGFEEQFLGDYQLYEDQAFLVKIYLCTPVYVSGTCWDRYRQHPDSCVSTVTEAGAYHTVRRYFLEWLEEYLATYAGGGTLVRRRLQRILWSYRHPQVLRAVEYAQQIGRTARQLLQRLYNRLRP